MNYPLASYHFTVDWGGTHIDFTSICDLEVEVDVIEFRSGASPEYSSTKMPGLVKYSDITLKRGSFVNDNEFFDWFDSIQLNQVPRRDIVVKLLNEQHEPVRSWKIKSAFPRKVRYGDLNASKSEYAIEELTLAHEDSYV